MLDVEATPIDISAVHGVVPTVIEQKEPSSSPEMSLYQEYIHLSRYSRFLEDEGRRETWNETVARYFDFFTVHLKERCGYTLKKELRRELETAVLRMEVMPSMRCMMTAGEALRRDEMAGFNCQYVAVEQTKVFSEILYLLMCGCGVGFSVERQYVNKLPEVPEKLHGTDTTIVCADSKIGWAKALDELIHILYSGTIPKWDLSKLRPAGAVLKVFGGRASGPEPLDRLFKFVVSTFQEAQGRRLSSIECHDIICNIAETVVVGGVRRSATISLSNLSDDRMRSAKSGQWWTLTPWRSIANNSAVYTDERPTTESFMNEWKSLYESKSGERGIFSRHAVNQNVKRSNDLRTEWFGTAARLREMDHEWGVNPCGEVVMRSKESCNLTEVVVRWYDTIETIIKKVKIASILGTFQSTLTNYRFLSKKWKDNNEDERLLGVSLTGIMDNKLTSGELGIKLLSESLLRLRREVISTNMNFANALGIPPSVAATVVKPSGTVSALVDSGSGIHARFAPWYLRSVRSDKKDPLAQMMVMEGFPHEDDKVRPDANWVFYFPAKAPTTSVFRHDMNAIRQLEIWSTYQQFWTEHNPSVTISVRDNEWMRVGAWVFDNFDKIAGVSFLPYSDHVYVQAPFQDLTETQYNEWAAKMPTSMDWSKLKEYEKSDQTTGSQEMACVSGACTIS